MTGMKSGKDEIQGQHDMDFQSKQKKKKKFDIILNETCVSFDGEQNTITNFLGPQVKKPPNKLFVWEAIKIMFIIVLGIELFIQQLS